jgi:hypothetical protein
MICANWINASALAACRTAGAIQSRTHTRSKKSTITASPKFRIQTLKKSVNTSVSHRIGSPGPKRRPVVLNRCAAAPVGAAKPQNNLVCCGLQSPLGVEPPFVYDVYVVQAYTKSDVISARECGCFRNIHAPARSEQPPTNQRSG